MAGTTLLLVFCLFFTCHTTVRADFGNIEIAGRLPTRGLIDRIASAPDTDIAYGIGTISRTLSIIDRNTHKVQKEVSFQAWPAGLAVDPANNNAFVLCQGTSWPVANDGSLTVVSPQGQIVASRPLPRTSRDIAINPENRTAVVTVKDDRKLLVLSLDTLATIREITLPYLPKSVCLDPDSGRAVVTARQHQRELRPTMLLVVDLTSGTLLYNLPFTNGIKGMAVNTELDIAVALGDTVITLVDIPNGTLIATLTSAFSFSPRSPKTSTGEVDIYGRVVVNSSTHTAIISGEGGFLLVNLVDHTTKSYQPEGVTAMWAVAEDQYRNTFLGSYWKYTFPLTFEMGALEIKLPSPVPEIISVVPAEAPRGSDGLTITVTGKQFIKTSSLLLNAQIIPVTFIDNTRLQGSIPKEFFQAVGIATLVVTNPSPQGGTSNALSFTVTNPTPVLTVIDPASAYAGTSGITVNIMGAGFFPDTTVSVNNTIRQSSFINATRLQTYLMAPDLAQADSLALTAANAPPGGGTSNTMAFTVFNTSPVLASISPASVNAGTPSLTLTLTGSGFLASSTVRFNGNPVPSTFIDTTKIEVSLAADLIKAEGSYPVTVTNPEPGGGTSATLTFTVQKAGGNVQPLPEGSFGKKYEDLIPSDATIPSYDPKRFALVTGLVRDIQGNPLRGVAVSVHVKPQYGTAMTDSSGRFSLPVEGGGIVTFSYAKPGLITSHRQVNVPWNGFANTETLTMLIEDTSATTLTFDNNPATVLTHQSTPYTDNRGTRFLTLVTTGDNKAYIKNSDGTETLSPAITVRATEFVTPESMPAVLPPNVAYTYCSELAVDGAKNVRFDKPVTVYVENFLGFNVGEIVPVGYYDRDRAVWVPSNNGVVVRLLDTNGDGIVDAYTDGKNQYPAPGLADPTSYPPNATFWRAQISHFSPWDWNLPWVPPTDAINPNPPGEASPDKQQACDTQQPTNSYVECRSRIFHDDIPIPGTDMALHYASNRVQGYGSVIDIPVSGANLPASLKRIIVKMEVAGRTFQTILPVQPNQQTNLTWDGRDYLGRTVTGTTRANISIGFVYNVFYASPRADLGQSFGQSGTYSTGVPGREEITYWRKTIIPMVRSTAEAGRLAEGWSLSLHHYLSPADPTILHKGNGTTVQAGGGTRFITTVAGNGQFYGYSGDGGPATQAALGTPSSMAVDEKGNLYIADTSAHSVRKVDSNGIITTVAGNGQSGFSGDGGPATQAKLAQPRLITIDNAGNLYIVDCLNMRIRRVDINGIITTVAGNGQSGFSGDGGPATQASLNPQGIAIDSAGNLYLAESNRIRKVDGNGIIATVAGNGQYEWSGDNGPAIEAGLGRPGVMAIDKAGNLFVSVTSDRGTGFEYCRIRKIGPDGRITTVAGQYECYWNGGDGGPATQANLQYPSGLAVDKAGNLYLSVGRCTDGSSCSDYRIRRVDVNGIITTVAGNGQSGFSGDGGPATRASFEGLSNLAIDAGNNIYVVDSGNSRVRKLFFPGVFEASSVGPDDRIFFDENGLGYVVTNTGLHKATIDLATFKTLLTFGYNQANQLITITDRFGNATTVERDGEGVPVSITSSDGIRTRLMVDANNHLTSIQYPNSTGYSFAYTPNGLMSDKYDQRGNRFQHSFDANGRISDVADPEGGAWTYTRSIGVAGNTTTTLVTAEGNTTTFQDRSSFTGTYTSTTTIPSGAVTTLTSTSDGIVQTVESSCGETETFTYDIDAPYHYKYLKQYTAVTPQRLTKTEAETRAYQDTNNDGIFDHIARTMAKNNKNWTEVNDSLTGTFALSSPLGRTVTRTYDPTSLLTRSIALPGLPPVTFGYDTRGRLTTTTIGGRTTTIAYNAQGNIGQVTSPDQKTHSYTYDPMGRPLTEELPNHSIITFNYNENGNMTILTNPKTVNYGFGYNGVNLRNSMTTPLSGNYVYAYDKERNLTSIAFPSGKQIVNTYIEGLLSATTTPEGTTDYTYACGTSIGSITKGTDSITYAWDGILLKTDTRAGLLNQAITYTWNNDFNPASMTYGGTTQTLGYDNDGLMTTASPFTISRNAQNGLPTGLTDGTLSISRSYSGYGELDGTTYAVGGTNKYGYTLTRDTMGRTTKKVETIKGVTTTFDYTYDDNSRFTEVKQNGAVVESYTYDPQGNRTRETNTLRGISNRVSTYSDEDHIITAGSDTYQFNIDGFLTQKVTASGTMTTSYSSRGELLSVTLPNSRVLTYDHDPLGRRIAKRVNGTITEKYLWQNNTKLLAVYDGSGNLIMRFTYADDRVPVSMTYSGATYYLSYDQVGSLRAASDTSGNIEKRIDYDTYGSIINDTNSAINIPFGFAGGLHDRDTGLVRFGARDYDPTLGRWTAKDPIDFAGGDTNLYGYVANDPVNGVDPEGLSSINFPANGNFYPGHDPDQDMICSPPAGGLNQCPAAKECCVEHDQCYKKYKCNASSWFNLNPFLSPCQMCNIMASLCIIGATTGDE
ncbi:MAG: tRNA nuclease WapA precursor [Syntrophorhabdus sp. PtaU1.Bin050]|nr:MAG: tRNA nuclease WapA precursor [Syntrophorhabdus sp. PtaU1.Bin050]